MAPTRISTHPVSDVVEGTVVRPANGADQEWYASVVTNASPVDLAAALVERCTDSAIPADAALALPIGRRNALVWAIRRASFGDALDAVIECTTCHEKLDVTVSVDDLTEVLADGSCGGEATAEIAKRSVRYRLPSGHDQLMALADADPASALCRACVVAVDGIAGCDLPDDVVDELIDPLGAAIAAADPLADTELQVECAVCGASFVAVLDAHDYLRDELLRGADRLLEELHVLASRYHWSEREILGLPLARRRAYLKLIADDGGGER